MLENAISAGVLSMGVDVLLLSDLCPHARRRLRHAASLRADAGASSSPRRNNPYADNPELNFSARTATSWTTKSKIRIENLVFSGEIRKPSAPRLKPSEKPCVSTDALGRYSIEITRNLPFPRGLSLEGMRVVLDCGNGAAYKSSPCVLRELGAEVIVYGNQPDAA